MPVPRCCPHLSCAYHHHPPSRWFVRYGSYHSSAHGRVQRYRCRRCRHTLSDQSESLQYFAKRRLPLLAIWLSLLSGASLREIARRYHLSPPTVQSAVLRLGRQAMAAQTLLLATVRPRARLLYDGLRSCVSSHDYPCDITTVVEPEGEMILTMCHTVTRRGGTMTAAQRRRVEAKLLRWHPRPGTMRRDISLIHREIWDYLRAPCASSAAELHTDEHPLYGALLARDAVARHLRRAGALRHLLTPGAAPRTLTNPLFAVNYIDRLLRHRLKEHTRETIAIGRQATLQMHRAWMFAIDHNCMREYRVRHPELGTHAEQGAVSHTVVRTVNREFFSRRLSAVADAVPETIRRVWMAELPSPPIRWKVGQKATSLHLPAYALRDLSAGYQHTA